MRKFNKRQANFIMTEAMGIVLALAVAFFFVAMPEDIFERLVSASGLPAILPAATPPLGETARMIVAALAGSLAGMAVILLFLLIDRQPPSQSDMVRPFFANSDLSPVRGVPLEDSQPLDRLLAREAPIAVAFEPIEEPSEVQAQETVAEPIFIDFQAIRAVNRVAGDQPLDLAQWRMVEPEIEPETDPRPIPRPDRRVEDESISALMARLEAGLEKRAERGDAPSSPPEINRSGVGLRSTLDELRKMAVKR